jgi:4-hydroxy 2-oxovalerate aldolase
MSVKILDCTLRDGGYLVNKQFPDEFISHITKALIDSGIDYIELGFLQNSGKNDSIIYGNEDDAKHRIPKERGNSTFTAFADNSRFTIENLGDYNPDSFENIRICFAKHEYRSALECAGAAKKKGYGVFVQPMDILGYSNDELLNLIEGVNNISPKCMSIVDTFGAMYYDDLHRIYSLFDNSLEKKINIGFHSHNNLSLSAALAEGFVALGTESDRDIVVDSSLYGMGRGAGNTPTEVIARYLNTKYNKNYNLDIIIDVIGKYVYPLKKNIEWGYSLPMFLCGCLNSHVDNVYYLQNKGRFSALDMYDIIGTMDLEKRKRYDFQYQKSDFSELETAVNEYDKKNKRI